MRGIIREIEKSNRRANEYMVYYNSPIHGERGRIDLYAKDEMDAYTQITTRLEKDKQDMQLLIKCVSIIIAMIILAAFGSGQVSRYYYSVNMATCVTSGKSYVSENEGYSCR